jgi:hypothetical protein
MTTIARGRFTADPDPDEHAGLVLGPVGGVALLVLVVAVVGVIRWSPILGQVRGGGCSRRRG